MDSGMQLALMGICIFISAAVAFTAGTGIGSSAVRRAEKEKKEKEKQEQQIANMREEMKKEILSELKNQKD